MRRSLGIQHAGWAVSGRWFPIDFSDVGWKIGFHLRPIGSMYGIYTNIGGILMGSMLPYIAAYMDPMVDGFLEAFIFICDMALLKVMQPIFQRLKRSKKRLLARWRCGNGNGFHNGFHVHLETSLDKDEKGMFPIRAKQTWDETKSCSLLAPHHWR